MQLSIILEVEVVQGENLSPHPPTHLFFFFETGNFLTYLKKNELFFLLLKNVQGNLNTFMILIQIQSTVPTPSPSPKVVKVGAFFKLIRLIFII